MARLIPNVWTELFPEGHPEHDVYLALSKLPNHYTIFYSKKFKGAKRAKEECEVDFLIFDGSQNLICLEVKGGLINYDGTQNKWFQNDEPMALGVDRQASAARAAVIEFLGDLGKDVNIDWALCFPNCSLPAHLGATSEAPRDLIIDSESLLDITSAVGTVESYFQEQHGRSGTSQNQATEIIKTLQRSMGFVQKVGHRIARDASMITNATEEQMDVLFDLELNKRVIVEGYAGTGKTMIATEYAKRLAEDGKQVLLLFYNRMIAGHVRYGLGRDSSIECQTFHHFAREEIAKADPDWWDHQDKKAQNFWDDVIPLKLIEVIEEHQDKEARYDAIIVDEGQDFKQDWFDILDSLLVDPKASQFIIFLDAQQDLFGRWKNVSWSDYASRMTLRKNCRNTKKIVTYLQENFASHMRAFEVSPLGVDINEHIGTPEQSRNEFRKEVEKLLKEGVSAGDIMVLTNAEGWAASALHSMPPIKGHNVAWARKYDKRSNDIQVSTINQFKGMESAVVLITDIPKYQKDEPRLYTQISRGQVYVSLYFTT